MYVEILILILASHLIAQIAGTEANDVPALTAFVAPAYPRAAKDLRIMGTTVTHIIINRDGVVTHVTTIKGHPVFVGYVVEALKKWRFKPSDQQHTLEVTCSFELRSDKCEGTNKHPITSETHVSAELPTIVHIETGVQCRVIPDAEKEPRP
jgi:TonB family protein